MIEGASYSLEEKYLVKYLDNILKNNSEIDLGFVLKVSLKSILSQKRKITKISMG